MTAIERTYAHGGNGKFIRTVATAERDSKAAQLRSKGYTFRRIADELGYADGAVAKRAVDRALAETVSEGSEELRRVLTERLNDVAARAYEIAERQHFVTSAAGKIVKDDEGNALIDDMPNLHAQDRIMKATSEVAKLHGVYAAVQTAFTVRAGAEVDEQIENVLGQLRCPQCGNPFNVCSRCVVAGELAA